MAITTVLTMLFNEVIELGNLTETISYGEVISSYTYRTIFADKQSVRQSEHYEARQIGLKPELMFVIRSSEFANDERLKYKNKVYEIIRTFDKGETIELVCGALNNG